MPKLKWLPVPRTPHGMMLVASTFLGERKMAAIFDENSNPLKPKGTPGLNKPFNVELYFPVYNSSDRIVKCVTREEAHEAINRRLRQFLKDMEGLTL